MDIIETLEASSSDTASLFYAYKVQTNKTNNSYYIMLISSSTGGINRHLILQDSTRTFNTYNDKIYTIYIDNTNKIIMR